MVESFQIKYQGFALPIVLIYFAILSFFISLTFQYITAHNKYINSIEQAYQLEYLAKGGLIKTLWMLRTGEIKYNHRESIEIIPDTCKVDIKFNGLFLDISSTAKINNDQITYKGIIGYQGIDLFSEALRVDGEVPVFVLSQNTIIDGDFKTKVQNIHYKPRELKNSNIITGKVIQDSELKFINTDSQLLDSLLDDYQLQIEDFDRSLFLAYDEGLYTPNDFTESFIYFEGDGIITSDDFSKVLEGPGTIISKGSLTFQNAVTLQGKWKILSNVDIFIKDSCAFDDVIMYSKSGIYLDGLSKIKGQIFSKKQILAKGNTNFQFPSYLTVPQNEIKPSIEPEIGILDNTLFNGLIIMYYPKSDSIVSSRFRQYGRVLVKTSTTITGGIYSEGALEISGNIHGFISARTIEQQIGPTHWTNYLQDTQVLRDELNPFYPLPICFDNQKHLKLLNVFQGEE